MNLTQEEKNKLISAKDESQWFKIIDEIRGVHLLECHPREKQIPPHVRVFECACMCQS